MKKNEYLRLTVQAIALLCCTCGMAAWLCLSEEDMLMRMEDMNLFLPTREYLQSLMVYPGGLLSWMGCWCTEWLHRPALGCMLMAALWWLIAMDTRCLTGLKGVGSMLALLPAMALMATVVQTGYWLYYAKLEGYMFVPTLGVVMAVLSASVFRALGNSALWVRALWLVAWTALAYPLAGAWALAATALQVLLPAPGLWEDEDRKKRLREGAVLAAVAVAAVLIVPQIWYGLHFCMTSRETLYVAGVPSFRVGQDNMTQYHWPYYAIAVAFAVCAAWGALVHFCPKMKAWMRWVTVAAVLAIGAFGVNSVWYRDINFHKEIRMTQAIEALDWERVLSIYLEPADSRPTRIMVLYKNLALFRLGRAGEDMFKYQNGGEYQHAPWMVRMTQVGGKLLYYHYGKENFCYRWCMEDGVEFGWKVEYLKMLAKTSLINQDWEVARKYLNLLSKTRYHKEWADKYIKYVGNWEMVKTDPEMEPIVRVLSGTDWLDGDNTLIEMYLIHNFSKGQGADPLFQELTLLFAMIAKDIELFWPRFFQYAHMHQGERMPRYYQEAAYLYGQLEPDNVDVSGMPFDRSVIEGYEKFMQFNQQCGSMTEEQKRIAFRPQFGDTFYYFYFLERGVKTN